MMKIGSYDVTQGNGGVKSSTGVTYPPRLRIMLNGCILAQVFPGHARPLHWVRKWANDPARKELIAQLRANGVSDDDVQMILKFP